MDINATTIALVTGASRGLGYATAVELARKGAHVIALARTVGGLEDLDDAIKAAGGTATLVPLDITDEAGLQRMCLSIFERWGHLDLLVHCAAHAVLLSPVAHVTEKDFDRMWAVNARATQRIIAMTEPLLKAADAGTAVFINDPKGGQKFFAGYGTTKAASQAIVDSWTVETKTIGPRVISFTPDPMPTGIRARFFPGEDQDKLFSTKSQAERLVALL